MTIKIIERTKTLSNFDLLHENITCTASKMGQGSGMANHEGFTQIGYYIVPSQLKIAIGLRGDMFNPNSGGIFHCELHDASNNDIEGEYLVVLSNANYFKQAKIIKRHSTMMYKTEPTQRDKQALLKLGVNSPLIWAREDSMILLFFKPFTDGVTIDFDNVSNKLILDITVQYPYEATQEFI